MATETGRAAHVLAQKYPELATDAVSRYVSHLKETLGPAKASAVYSLACRAAPIGENPMGLSRGSVVEIDGEPYLALGSSFMKLEFASLIRPGICRTMAAEEFVKLGAERFKVFDEEDSRVRVEEVLNT